MLGGLWCGKMFMCEALCNIWSTLSPNCLLYISLVSALVSALQSASETFTLHKITCCTIVLQCVSKPCISYWKVIEVSPASLLHYVIYANKSNPLLPDRWSWPLSHLVLLISCFVSTMPFMHYLFITLIVCWFQSSWKTVLFVSAWIELQPVLKLIISH